MEAVTLKNLPNREERAEIGKKARAIYNGLNTALEKDYWGEYIAINVDNGDYILSTDQTDATRKILKKYPGILPFVIRIGYRAVYHFGGSGLKDGKRP